MVHNSAGNGAQRQRNCRRACCTPSTLRLNTLAAEIGQKMIPALTARNTGSGAPERWLSHAGHPAPKRRNIHKVLYYNLLTSGKLHSHLADTEEQAQQLFLRLVNEYAANEGITEQLKATDPMAWVQRMNNIRERVTEMVNAEVVFV